MKPSFRFASQCPGFADLLSIPCDLNPYVVKLQQSMSPAQVNQRLSFDLQQFGKLRMFFIAAKETSACVAGVVTFALDLRAAEREYKQMVMSKMEPPGICGVKSQYFALCDRSFSYRQ
jgi:hypothetical protein